MTVPLLVYRRAIAMVEAFTKRGFKIHQEQRDQREHLAQDRMNTIWMIVIV